MSTVKEYFDIAPETCVFHTSEDQPCGETAVAVYVTADHLHIAKYVCLQHAVEAERAADGPVFWSREATTVVFTGSKKALAALPKAKSPQ